MHKIHKKEKRQQKRKFIGLKWHVALSAMRAWIGVHPDARIHSSIQVSADPSDRQMPVSAACVFDQKNLVLFGAPLWLIPFPTNSSPCSPCLRVRPLSSLVNLVPLCGYLSGIGVNLRFLSWRSWRFNLIRVLRSLNRIGLLSILR